MWILLVVSLTGQVSGVEFASKEACMNARIKIEMIAVRGLVDQEFGFIPTYKTACVPKGD